MIAVKVENIDAARPQVGLRSGRHRLRRGGRGRPDPADRGLPHRLPDPARAGPQRPQHRRPAVAAVRQARPGLLGRQLPRCSARSTRPRSCPIDAIDPRQPPGRAAQRLRQPGQDRRQGDGRQGARHRLDLRRRRPAGRQARPRPVRKVGNDTFTFGYPGGRYSVRWHGKTYVDGDTGKRGQDRQRGDHERCTTTPTATATCSAHPRCSPTPWAAARSRSTATGVKITGSWRRTKASGPLRFTDDSGKIIALKPGKTWVLLKG